MVQRRNARKQPVLKPYNGGTMSEAAMRSWIRSQLRRLSLRWRPISQKRSEGQRAAGAADWKRWGNRIRVVNTCEVCGEWWPKSRLEIDHIVPCGSLLNIEQDAGPFIMRMLVEKEGLQRICPPCHQRKMHA